MARRSRKDIYKDTKYYHYHNANPKNRITGDCVVRALTTALCKNYADVVRDLANLWCETGYCGIDKKGIERYLTSLKFTKMKEPRKYDNTKMSLREFIDSHDVSGKNIICFAGTHHVSCIIDGVVQDIWDCTRETMHTYWVVG